MQKLFNQLIELAKLQISELDHQQFQLLQNNVIGELFGCQIVIKKSSDPSPIEADSIRAEIVEALVLAGDLVFAQKIADEIEDQDEAMLAQESILRGWARKDLGHALRLASTTSKTTDNEYIDEDEQKEQHHAAMFIILETIADTSKPDKVRKLADLIIRQSNHGWQQNEARVMRVRATAAMGKIDEARKMVAEEEAPCNQVPGHLAVFKFSHAIEDIEAARAIAEKYNYKPYKQWLKIAEATHEVRDIEKARAEILAIPIRDTREGWTADFERNFNLLALAKISVSQNDFAVVREALIANPQTGDSLFMELCRVTRDPKDFTLLLNRAKNGEGRYSALACVAEITREKFSFIAASKAALSISDPPEGVSVGYLRGRSLAELAQVLSGKHLDR